MARALAMLALAAGASAHSPPAGATLIVSHNTRKGYFTSGALLHNKGNPASEVYSILGDLKKEDWVGAGGEYEFFLQYEGLPELHWTQRHWIMDNAIAGTEMGARFISPSNLNTNRAGTCEQFWGLGRSSSPGSAILDGNSGSGCWWNSVASTYKYGNGMPAWGGNTVASVKLYIKAPAPPCRRDACGICDGDGSSCEGYRLIVRQEDGYYFDQGKTYANDQDRGLYNILSTLGSDSFIQEDGTYELKMQYENDPVMHWTQTSWIMDSVASGSMGTKFLSPNLNKATAHPCSRFWGLGRSSSPGSAWLDGNGKDGCWWNSVASFAPYSGAGMPAWDQQVKKSLKLWIKKGKDCNGVQGGDATVDECGVCGGGGESCGYKLIVNHDSNHGYFAGANVFSKNTGDPTNPLYSILGDLNKADYVREDGKYHLKMQYDDNEPMVWHQKSWIMENIHGDQMGVDFISPSNLNGHRAGTCEQFWGLGKSSSPDHSMLDGNGASGCWWNAVGSRQSYSNGGMPAFGGTIARRVKLWILETTCVHDECGVCGGDNSSCKGCDGVVNSGKEELACGCDDAVSCLGCDGVAHSGKVEDDCGVCGGNNSDKDDCGDCFGENGAMDACGVCGGDGSSCCNDKLGLEECARLVGSKFQQNKLCNGALYKQKCAATCGHCNTSEELQKKITKALLNEGRPAAAPEVTLWHMENCKDKWPEGKCYRKMQKFEGWCTQKPSHAKKCGYTCGAKVGCDICADGPTKNGKIINTARCELKIQTWANMCSGKSKWASACRFSCNKCSPSAADFATTTTCEDVSDKCEAKLSTWAGMCANPTGAWKRNCQRTCGDCDTPVPPTPVPATPVPEPAIPPYAVKIGDGECANERGVLNRDYFPFGEGDALSLEDALLECLRASGGQDGTGRRCHGISYAPWGYDMIIYAGEYDHAGPGGYGPITTTSPHNQVACYKLETGLYPQKIGAGGCQTHKPGGQGYGTMHYNSFSFEEMGKTLSLTEAMNMCAETGRCAGISYKASEGFNMHVFAGAAEHKGNGGYGEASRPHTNRFDPITNAGGYLHQGSAGYTCYKVDRRYVVDPKTRGPEHRWDRTQCGHGSTCDSYCMYGELEHGSEEPWCYHRFSNKCAVNGHDRQDYACGEGQSGGCAHLTHWRENSHKKWECESQGGCWQPTSHGENRPWCFKPNIPGWWPDGNRQ